MSEYTHVERPFLDQLAELGWVVIDQGCGYIPSDPALSLRSSFYQCQVRRFRRSCDIETVPKRCRSRYYGFVLFSLFEDD